MKSLFIVLFAFLLYTAEGQSNPSQASKPAKRCQGTTKNGSPCKSIMVMKSGYCRSHDPASPKCGAKTASGTCKMTVKNPGDRCRFHNN